MLEACVDPTRDLRRLEGGGRGVYEHRGLLGWHSRQQTDGRGSFPFSNFMIAKDGSLDGGVCPDENLNDNSSLYLRDADTHRL